MWEVIAILLTLAGYMVAKMVSKKYPFVQPMIAASILVWLVWWLINSDWQLYDKGGSYISFFLGPATVALAIPLAKQFKQVLELWKAILVGVASGCIVAISSSWFMIWIMGGDQTLIRSMISKSVTTPISVELTNTIGGIPALAALFTAVTGIVGSLLYRLVIRVGRISDDWAIGLAVGTSAHAVGTAGMMNQSQRKAAASSLAMILAGIITSIYFIPIQMLLS